MKPAIKSATRVALIYTRVSTARQATDGVGLDSQEAKARAHAQRMGWEVQEVFSDEGISGRDGVEDRPGLQKLIAAAQAAPGAIVVVYSVSRLARRQKLLWSLLDTKDGHGLSISSATEAFDTSTPSGRAMVGMLGVFAALEADMASERTKDALAELRAKGVKLGPKSMVEKGLHETVRLIQGLYETGNYSHRSLAVELNSRGVATSKNRGKWWAKTVRTALNVDLSNPTIPASLEDARSASEGASQAN